MRPFEGKATLTLMGLPPNTAAAPKEIGSADAEVVFDVTTKEETPVGQHRGLFCELAVPMNGEIVTRAAALGLEAPVNAEAQRMVHELAHRRLAPGISAIYTLRDRLAASRAA